MGLFKISGCSNHTETQVLEKLLEKCRNGTPTTPNPNPYRFQILLAEQHGDHLLAKIRYPDCTTFEGIKLLVFRNTSAAELRRAPALDPHFCDKPSGHLTPFARFEPTDAGLTAARTLVKALG